MTPRTQLEVLDLADPHEELLQIVRNSGHSRFPVVEDNPNNIVGVVQVRDLLTAHLAGQPVDVRAAMRPPLFIPDTAPALKAMELFKQSGSSIALIVDEYGDLQGLVTLNDLLEALVGDIGTIDPNEEPEWVQREDGSYLVDGMMPLDELRDLLALNDLPGAGESQAQTLGGYMMALLKRIPEPADVAEVEGGWRFEVMDMDGRRVDKVLISPPVTEDTLGKDI
jgi:putative hemolysin